MATKSRFRSDISEAIHFSAAMLRKADAIDKATVRDFDARHPLAPTAIEPAQIKKLREANKVGSRSSPAISMQTKVRSRSGKPAPNGRAAWR